MRMHEEKKFCTKTIRKQKVPQNALKEDFTFLALSPWQSCRAAPLLDVRSVLSAADHHHHYNVYHTINYHYYLQRRLN